MFRPRRLRRNPAIRDMVQEFRLHKNDFVLPIFVHDQLESTPIAHLPGHQRVDAISLMAHCEHILTKGIRAIALFPVIDSDKKSPECDEAVNPDNLVCQVTRRIKKAFGDDIIVCGDIALDPYSSYGHDGIVKNGAIVNDDTLDILAKMACNQAAAGVDIVAPSDMMDGRVLAIRDALDNDGYHDTLIMAYTAKYASHLYGPFRDALASLPQFGDKKTYQMNYSNRYEAAIELDLDVAEGADIIMVKPATLYLDIISDFRASTPLPVAAYHVSGEYAMLHSAARDGYIDFSEALYESLTAIKRAGASIIVTYGALDIVDILQ
jgi:porphobilinogen synthase